MLQIKDKTSLWFTVSQMGRMILMWIKSLSTFFKYKRLCKKFHAIGHAYDVMEVMSPVYAGRALKSLRNSFYLEAIS